MPKAILKLTITCLLAGSLISCSTDTNEAPANTVDAAAEAEATVIAAADAYIDAWFHHFPEMATFYRIEGKSHDRLTDNTPEGRAAWQVLEDHIIPEMMLYGMRIVTIPGLSILLIQACKEPI